MQNTENGIRSPLKVVTSAKDHLSSTIRATGFPASANL
jgi:hypothetical protein